MTWTDEHIPDQRGRTIVITGANSGTGAAAARELAARGATVVLACRDVTKGQQAAARMGGDLSVRRLDLADLASVRAFAEDTGPVDVLVNNAGLMAVPEGRTTDGFEMQLGTNVLGHFALTGLLLPRITQRVVTMSSLAHLTGHVDLGDLNWRTRRYRRWGAYAQSKLADLIFARELQRRLSRAGSSVLSLAAHPGLAMTELTSHTESIQGGVITFGTRLFGQSATMGALPLIYAAASPDAAPGAYYGPGGLGEVRGYPRLASSSPASHDEKLAAALWDEAVRLTGVSFPEAGRAEDGVAA